jgi:hypothetical protein
MVDGGGIAGTCVGSATIGVFAAGAGVRSVTPAAGAGRIAGFANPAPAAFGAV